MKPGDARLGATIAPMYTALPARIRIVQSPANRWVKALRSAVAHPPGANAGSDALVALEGAHLVAEALRSGLALRALFLRAGEEAAAWQALQPHVAGGSMDAAELLALPPALFRSATGTETPQPIAALVAPPTRETDAGLAGPAALVLVLAGLQDPGNVGTLLRSGEALGATAAILLPGTASPWSGKALRASAGSALRLPWHPVRNLEAAAALLRSYNIRSYAATPSGGVPASEAALDRASALWIGNEGAGLSAPELAACDACITLPMPGPVESLNAAVAGSLLLYEACRQRRLLPGAGSNVQASQQA